MSAGKTIFGIKNFPLTEYAISANAIMGTRDSGKTYTATKATEELFDAGIPSIWLDPIGVAHNLRIPGAGRGYPVVVAGGQHGDLPLTVKNVGEIVRAAMKANISLVLDLFSRDLSKADWRRIVRETCEILLHENAEYGLRHVFIEEAAEFVPQRVIDGQVFSAVEKLVRMGGNSKVGITLINQRSADLNKSVLELCANAFVHRQRGKNTLLDLKKWMALAEPTMEKEIAASLPDLESGHCWVMSTELKAPVLIKVPKKNSLHPDRRAAHNPDAAKRKPVPAFDFVEHMKAALVEKAKPPVRQAAPALSSKPSAATLANGHNAGLEKARAAGFKEGQESVRAMIPAMLDAQHAASFADGAKWALDQVKGFKIEGVTTKPRKPLTAIKMAKVIGGKPVSVFEAAVAPARKFKPNGHGAGGGGGLDKPLQKIVDAIRWWNVLHITEPSHAQVGFIAGYAAGSGTWNRYLSALRSLGMIEASGPLVLTMEGLRAANEPDPPPTGPLARQTVLARLDGPCQRILEPLLATYPGTMSHEEAAEEANYQAGSGTWNRYLSTLRSVGVIAAKGPLKAQDWLFPEGA